MVFAHAQHPSEDVESLRVGEPRGASAYQPDHLGEKSNSRSALGQTQAHRVVRLKRRPEFLTTAASGRRWVMPAFILQVASRPGDKALASLEIGLGFTASRRVGNAVLRNRAKRRLREASRLLLPGAATPSHNYVLIARSAVLTCSFQTLINDLSKAFDRVLTAKPQKARAARPRGKSVETSASTS